MPPAPEQDRAPRLGWSRAQHDALLIFGVLASLWVVVERTETCDRFFDWVAENPDYELDSIILVFILSALGTLVFAWRRYREMKAAMIDQQMAEGRAHSLAYHDPLTGLPNRRALIEQMGEMIGGQGGERQFALLIADLDQFKAVNDVHGHPAGDELLRAVASRMTACLSSGQEAYRLGGDEFALLCEVINGDLDAPRRTARLMIASLDEPFEFEHLVHHIGVSIGSALYPNDAVDRETLLRRADVALYRAKESGRRQHRWFEAAMDAELIKRAGVERELRQVLGGDELRAHYQPIVELGSGRTVGYEMLARWRRGDGTVIGPEQFIPIAEESGLIGRLFLHLLRRACHDTADWDPHLTIAVNISPFQLKDPWLSQKVLAVLTESSFAPRRLSIEITENALIIDADNARRTVESFRNQGMTIGLDDFGTGYSSLQHLRLLPFDKIKIDRSFINAILTDPDALKMVRAIINLAQTLDLPVIAEGVESRQSADLLRDLGCTMAQGYYFGAPMAAGDIRSAGGVCQATTPRDARASLPSHSRSRR